MVADREEAYSQDRDPLLSGLPEVDGHRIVGSCLLYGPLGKGGMGQVYKGRHLKFDLDVAVKCLHGELARRDPQFVERFLREAQVSASLTNENLIRVYETGEQGGVYYLVMEFVEGETAAGRVARKGRLAVAEALTILQGASRGLAAAHREGTVHRDIKPENILISYRGEVKLADLGLAKATTSDQGMTVTGVGLGTPVYMPPEQFSDFKSVGPRSDVYSMGATLYFLLTGKRPFTGDSVHEIMHRVCFQGLPDIRAELPDLDSAVVEIVRRSTAREADSRYRDGDELGAAIREALAGARADIADSGAGEIHVPSLVSPPPARTLARARLMIEGPTATEPLHLPRSKWRIAAGVVAALVLAGLPLIYVLVSSLPGEGPRRQEAVESEEAPAPKSTAIHVPPGNTAPETSRDSSAPSEGSPGQQDETTPDATPVTVSPAMQKGLDHEQAGRLLDALGAFESAGRAGDENAGEHLARVLFKLAQSNRADDPGLAVEYARRSLEFVPSADVRELETRLVEDIRGQLGSIRLDSPAALAGADGGDPVVIDARTIELSGEVEYPGTRSVVIDGQVVATGGAFSLRHEFDADGPARLTIVARDSNGIEARRTWDLVVDTTPPALELSSPSNMELTPGQQTLAGTVRDMTACTVTARGQEATPGDDGTWQLEIEVADTTEEILVRARDAAGNESPVVRLVVRTPWPRLEGLEMARPADGPPWVYSTTRDSTVELVLIGSRIPDGDLTFEMGSDESRFSNEFPRHVVTLRPYLIGRFEVTNEQYRRFCDATGKSYPEDPYGEPGYFENAPHKPVVNVTWDDASAYCAWLGADLPTEAQWEYAATAGNRRVYPWGSALPTRKKVLANFSGFETTQERNESDADERAEKRAEDGHAFTAEVGFYEPGAFGIHDQAGNVSEWCRDPFSSYGSSAAAGTGLRKAAEDTDRRVHRGGSWASSASQLRCAHRDYAPRTKASETIGFRVGMDLPAVRRE